MNKELKKYVTDELLLIANNVTGEYTDKQVQRRSWNYITEAWTTR